MDLNLISKGTGVGSALIFELQKIKSDPSLVKPQRQKGVRLDFWTSKSNLTPARAPQKGFTLLEVIVALGIVAVGILAVSKAMSGHANTLIGSEDRMIGYWVAANQLEYARIIKTVPVAGEKSGRTDMAERTWFYRETTSSTADPRLYRVDIKVFTDEDEEHQVGFLFGYRLVPLKLP